MNKNKGFTLIEVVIVIMIIGILSGITLRVINVTGVRSKARDSQRISDLKKVQTALELYYADKRIYPTTSGSWQNLSELSTTLTGYINGIPADPTTGTTTPYKYYSDGSTYRMTTIMEVVASIGGSACGTGAPYSGNCYEVQNPL